MAQIRVNNLTFCYEGSYDNIFENVSFQIDTDWKLGFIGRNGKGKTTFLRLLMGELEYSGQISPKMTCTYFPYRVKDREKDTIEVLEELDPAYEFWKVCRELNLLEVDPEVLYRKFSTLSGGEQTKVLLALLFSGEEHFLLIDEPTNHLDMDAREKVADYLKSKKGFLLVSHDRNFLNTVVDHVLVLERREIQVMKGNFASWWEQKAKRDAAALAENQKLAGEIGRLKAASRQASGWSDAVEQSKFGDRSGESKIDRGFVGHKAAKMMKRAKNAQRRMEESIEEKEGLLNNLDTMEELKLFPLRYPKERLLLADKFQLAYREEPLFAPLSFELHNEELLALTGPNGCGKSSILKRILGEDIQTEGTLQVGSGLVISYVPQDVSELVGSLTDYARERDLPEALFLALLRKLDLPRVQFAKDLSCYSQGQKKKVALAASLLTRAHLYLWDEPLNYIDVFSRMQLAELIRTYRPTMILVEHDKSFLEETEARLIALCR